MGVNKRRMLGAALVVSLVSASCAKSHGSATNASAAVSVTPPPDPQSVVVLAAATGPYGAMPTLPITPSVDPYREALADAYKAFKTLGEGKNGAEPPLLAGVAPALYGLVIVTVQGAVYEIGSARAAFSIQSLGEPFTAARAIETAGAETVERRIGVTPARNPLTTAGAIATIDLLPVARDADRWSALLGNLEAFAGHRLTVDDAVYRSGRGTIQGEPTPALDLETRQGAVSVSARDLAIMGATLANGGRNPLSGALVVSPPTAAKVLAVLSTAGLSDSTGEWLYKIGVPAGSGLSGGIVAVAPGRFAVGAFSPPLDSAGNSVRGQRAIEVLVQRLGGNVFASKPAAHGRPTVSVSAAGGPAKK